MKVPVWGFIIVMLIALIEGMMISKNVAAKENTEMTIKYEYFQTFCLGYMVAKGKAYTEMVNEIEKDRRELLRENENYRVAGNNMSKWIDMYFKSYSTNECSRYRAFQRRQK